MIDHLMKGLNELVSICIPAFDRPELLRQAVQSCLDQTYGNLEILVSDDSRSTASESAVREWVESGRVMYQRHMSPLGQARNVNHLFDWASGDRLLLLHDDDVLMPTCVADLLGCWTQAPQLTASYGKQQVMMGGTGRVSREASDELNRSHWRTARNEGVQASSLQAAIIGQFPNDGYLLLASVARSVRYSEDRRIGAACDLDFGLRLAAAGSFFYFLNKVTARYRITPVSISSQTNYADRTYELLASFPLPAGLEPLRKQRLRQFAPSAVSAHLGNGNIAGARAVFLSGTYPARRRFTLRGIAQALVLVLPNVIARRLIRVMQKVR